MAFVETHVTLYLPQANTVKYLSHMNQSINSPNLTIKEVVIDVSFFIHRSMFVQCVWTFKKIINASMHTSNLVPVWLYNDLSQIYMPYVLSISPQQSHPNTEPSLSQPVWWDLFVGRRCSTVHSSTIPTQSQHPFNAVGDKQGRTWCNPPDVLRQ